MGFFVSKKFILLITV